MGILLDLVRTPATTTTTTTTATILTTIDQVL